MKREEIESFVNDYVGGLHLGFTSEFHSKVAFVSGAEWRIACVWFPASEKPLNDGMILAVCKNGRVVLCGPNNRGWKRTVKTFEIVKWAYVSDLLPDE